jgi:hypothetical protein
MEKLSVFITITSDGGKIIFRSFEDALTTLETGQLMEEWTEHEDHCNMILKRRYRKDQDGSVLVIPLRQRCRC